MNVDRDYCISSYLALRYVAKPDIGWAPGVMPAFPNRSAQGKVKVKTAAEVLDGLRESVRESCQKQGLGILLSAGMDSAIIAALLPRGTRAYTVRFVAADAIDEAPAAAAVAQQLGLRHTIVDVTWDDYQEGIDLLMKHKRAPLHPAEVALWKASRAARQDGVSLLAVGNGADSTFGGMDLLLSKDWTFDEFVRRYTFLDPVRVVKNPVSVSDTFEHYRQGNGVNVTGFLKVVHGLGIIQMFENAIHAGGCDLVAPFERLALDAPLDLARIRGGEPKYILNEVFHAVCPGLAVPRKIAFARPVTQWLAGWPGPTRPEFRSGLTMTEFAGEQKWQMYCLERFLNLIDEDA